MAFSEELVHEVWERAKASADQDPSSVWRLDECGAWMRREHYGRENSEFGWKVEVTSAGGPETIENLRAFNMATHSTAPRGAPSAACSPTAWISSLGARERTAEQGRRTAPHLTDPPTGIGWAP